MMVILQKKFHRLPATGLPLHRHSLKLPGKWKRDVSDPRKWRSPLNILRETSWQNPRSRPYCVLSHHLYLNEKSNPPAMLGRME